MRTQALGHFESTGCRAVGQHHQKLFAAPAAHVVGAAQGRMRGLAKAAQHPVATCVTVLIVDAFEVVDVHHAQHQLAAASPCQRELLLGAF